ncbi:putative transporter subunit: ATP-binding component of ABC superfamily [Georgfuchsia toluolica]|uniref:Transporter subunit: ATP-binding component of ABC superfamily n=1 Tax=Georgfuchsia toluolica TaxID=424218 RepID=A0A916J598_9PROT|nr:ABC transporter ATP-binding protein [Georgfuchsia toluolica]CAG4884253.1 putative transporter subunit: ATP-binding component of ABC superfamily [Georgfuchsia toluolica]
MPPAIRISQVTKRYGQLLALDQIDLEIRQGEFFGLLGPNGAGKTTLISSIAGLVKPDGGRIVVMGHDVQSDYRNSRRLLGVVPQEIVFDPFFTVRETLQFQSGYYGIRKNDVWIDEILANLDLDAKANANMRSLSGGMKRRVLVAQALVHRPPVIVLDEPTAGVDVELRQTLWKFIRRLNEDGHTIVLTTHYLEEAESQCGRIAMLKAGYLIALDSTSALLRRFSSHLLSLRLRPGDVLPERIAQHARQNGTQWQLQCEHIEEVENVLAELRAAGCVIEDMEIGKPDLEDVFVKLMHSGEVVT